LIVQGEYDADMPALPNRIPIFLGVESSHEEEGTNRDSIKSICVILFLDIVLLPFFLK
jgi:hypothetical protein